MQHQPLVSVVTIFLNTEKYLQEAIESVLAQTYPHWELLLVDDGSTDGSTAIARHYAEQFPNQIRYLEHPEHQNLGKSVSRNLGIHQAKGEYIALLDADDVFLAEKLEKQVAILEAHPNAAMVYGPTLYWHSWTQQPQDRKRDFMSGLGVPPNQQYEPPTLLTLYLNNSGVVPCTCGLLARRSTVEAVGGFDETIQYMYEDQIFLAKICLQAPVYVESGCWDQYRQHLESSSHEAIRTGEYHPAKPNPARRAFLHWLAQYLTQQSIQNPELWRALNRELWPYRYPRLYSLWSQTSRGLRYLKRQAKRVLQPILSATPS